MKWDCWNILTPSSYTICSTSPLFWRQLYPHLQPQRGLCCWTLGQCSFLFSSSSIINTSHFPNTVVKEANQSNTSHSSPGQKECWKIQGKKNEYMPLTEAKKKKSIIKQENHWEFSQLQNLKNSKQPKGKKEIVWGVCLQVHYTSFKLLMQPQVGLEKGGAPWS